MQAREFIYIYICVYIYMRTHTSLLYVNIYEPMVTKNLQQIHKKQKERNPKVTVKK